MLNRPLFLEPKHVLASLALLFTFGIAPPAQAQLQGHGGPVRALAAAPEGGLAISGSFDQSAILWAIEPGAAMRVLRVHEGAVNAVAAAGEGRFLTAGEDGRIALWQAGSPEPVRVFAEHTGPVAGLALSPDASLLASASWDGTVRVRPLAGGEARVLSGHAGTVNAVAFLADGRLISAGYDGTLRIWPASGEGAPEVITIGLPLNAVAVAPDGEIITAGADGEVRILSPDGRDRASVALPPNPVIAAAISPDGKRIAAATVAGAVAIIARAEAKVLFNLVGPGLPVWSLAYRPDGSELLTGGGDRLVRRWNAATGEPIGALAMPRPADALAAYKGERGAEVFRACVACHTLKPNEGQRAGPTLSGVFGRRIATAPDYRFSEPLKKLDIVWDARTIAELFEVGPARYTPGTKMPEQTIRDQSDREALVRFLERATRRD
ncbi:MAG: c-type cytochrome [Methylobacterium sp.]|uniref:c-type cytochrome n=1 Tax=Methylobacterium sp. TaxID=409 RepID=UPI0025D2B8F5|nr:c-type cytochrome [Methylobacterium sp.]MBX9932708.1 c-type cytochrome [Methylobacterium sp.]